jgi:hypothetical protein
MAIDPYAAMRATTTDTWGMNDQLQTVTAPLTDIPVAGRAFCGNDLRSFILPSYMVSTDHQVFNTPSFLYDKNFSYSKLTMGQLDMYLNQSYISNLAAISVSTHRDKFPVRVLGRMDPVGFGGSQRTVAGSLVFYMTDASPISQLQSAQYRMELLRADELPLFDLYVTFMDDDGNWSSTVIRGMTILDEGAVIENSSQEGVTVTYSYMATSCEPITPGFFSFLGQLPAQNRTAVVNNVYADQLATTVLREIGSTYPSQDLNTFQNALSQRFISSGIDLSGTGTHAQAKYDEISTHYADWYKYAQGMANQDASSLAHAASYDYGFSTGDMPAPVDDTPAPAEPSVPSPDAALIQSWQAATTTETPGLYNQSSDDAQAQLLNSVDSQSLFYYQGTDTNITASPFDYSAVADLMSTGYSS